MRAKNQRIYRDPYSVDELQTLIEDYEELSDLRSKAWIQVRLMDVDRGMVHLRPKERAAVLLCGMMGLTVRTAAKLCGVPVATMWRHYNRGMSNLASYLNGGS